VADHQCVSDREIAMLKRTFGITWDAYESVLRAVGVTI
jgi:hypothetical protein